MRVRLSVTIEGMTQEQYERAHFVFMSTHNLFGGQFDFKPEGVSMRVEAITVEAIDKFVKSVEGET